MRYVFGIVALCIVGVGAWNLGHALSPSSVDVAFGVVVGTFAGVPTLLLLAYAIGQTTGRQAPTQHMTIDVVHRVALPEPPHIDGTCSRFDVAHPFGLLEVTR